MVKITNDLHELKSEISEIYREKKTHLDKYDVNAFIFIISHLEQIIYECNTGQLKSKNERYGHISRIIVDNDISFINPDLGGRLIEVEQRYIDLNDEMLISDNLSYVKHIHEGKILIICKDKEKEYLLTSLNAKRKLFYKNSWILKYQNENALAEKLQSLNNINFMFSGSTSGWNPADIFISLREKGLVTGSVTEICWLDQNRTISRIL